MGRKGYNMTSLFLGGGEGGTDRTFSFLKMLTIAYSYIASHADALRVSSREAN